MVGVIIIPLAVAVVVGIAVVLIIRWARKKKKVSSEVLPSSDKAQVAKTQDDTQFWVCPNCGNNTQMKDGRQYCPSCKIYLSI